MSNLWNQGIAARARRVQLLAHDDVAAPPDSALADRYAEGLAEGRRCVELEYEADRATLLTLVEDASRFEPCEPEPLAALLSETVLRLVEDIVGNAPVDADLLCRRARALAGVICGAPGPVVLSVCSEDQHLLAGLGDGIIVRTDPDIVSGALRMTVGARSAEDGPLHALDRLRAAMRNLAA